MPRFLLVILLALSGLVALTPGLSWLAGRWLPFVDERWMELLGASSTTVPIGLAVAALLLVIHGMRTNRQLIDEVLDELEELHEEALVGAPAGAGGTGAAAPAGAPAPDAGKGAGKKPGKMKKKSGRVVKRSGRRVAQRGKGMARREMRKAMPRI